MPGLPPDVQDLLEQLEAAEREAGFLTAGLDDTRANWQPQQGRAWSVAQCLDHLARATEEYLAPMAGALARARERGKRRRGPIVPGVLAAWFIRTLEPPVRRRTGAPQAIAPVSALPLAEALARFQRSQQRARALLQESAALDLSVRFANPFVRGLRFRTGAGFAIIAAHDRRHLWQARRVLESPGFPAR